MKLPNNLILIITGLNIILFLNIALKTIFRKPVFSEFVNTWIDTGIYALVLGIALLLTDLIRRKFKGKKILIPLLSTIIFLALFIILNYYVRKGINS